MPVIIYRYKYIIVMGFACSLSSGIFALFTIVSPLSCPRGSGMGTILARRLYWLALGSLFRAVGLGFGSVFRN